MCKLFFHLMPHAPPECKAERPEPPCRPKTPPPPAAQTAPLRETQPDGSRHPFDTFICAKTPAGRWGDPEDMVGPCVFLASHASDFVNGQILYADGGILAYIGRQPK